MASMPLPAPLAETLAPFTGAVRHAEPVGGGCIANATRVEAAEGVFFLKWSEEGAGLTFEAEAEGLRTLRAVALAADLLIPDVLAAENAGDAPGFLLTEWIDVGRADARYWTRFGEALATLHRAEASVRGAEGPYGFTADNFIGRLPQSNRWHADWPAFFREERLRPQIERARRSGRWEAAWDRLADRLLARLEDLLPRHPYPSLLHGDLWSGNALAVSDGRAALIDPAAYVEDRLADLAMTELFGGFDPRFYQAYEATWISGHYGDIKEVYNLYHLINHVNHFGAGYAGGVARILRRFG